MSGASGATSAPSMLRASPAGMQRSVSSRCSPVSAGKLANYHSVHIGRRSHGRSTQRHCSICRQGRSCMLAPATVRTACSQGSDVGCSHCHAGKGNNAVVKALSIGSAADAEVPRAAPCNVLTTSTCFFCGCSITLAAAARACGGSSSTNSRKKGSPRRAPAYDQRLLVTQPRLYTPRLT